MKIELRYKRDSFLTQRLCNSLMSGELITSAKRQRRWGSVFSLLDPNIQNTANALDKETGKDWSSQRKKANDFIPTQYGKSSVLDYVLHIIFAWYVFFMISGLDRWSFQAIVLKWQRVLSILSCYLQSEAQSCLRRWIVFMFKSKHALPLSQDVSTILLYCTDPILN